MGKKEENEICRRRMERGIRKGERKKGRKVNGKSAIGKWKEGMVKGEENDKVFDRGKGRKWGRGWERGREWGRGSKMGNGKGMGKGKKRKKLD